VLHEDITALIINAFYDVHHELGHGFLESAYEGAMVIALRARGLHVERQHRVAVHYRGEIVGVYTVDLLVEDRVIVELKAVRALEPIHEAQLINYLRASSIEVGLILHFAPKAAFRRFILTNDQKPSPSLRTPSSAGAAQPGAESVVTVE
jgi:GxxExxY protein